MAGLILPDTQWLLADDSLTIENSSLNQKLTIERDTVTQIVEFPKFLRVIGANHYISIPRAVGEYYDLRDLLSKWATIQPSAEPQVRPTTGQTLGALAFLSLTVTTPTLVILNFFFWELLPTLILSASAITGAAMLIRIFRKARETTGERPLSQFMRTYVLYIVVTVIKLAIVVFRSLG